VTVSQANLALILIQSDINEMDPIAAYAWATLSSEIPSSKEILDKLKPLLNVEILRVAKDEVERLRICIADKIAKSRKSPSNLTITPPTHTHASAQATNWTTIWQSLQKELGKYVRCKRDVQPLEAWAGSSIQNAYTLEAWPAISKMLLAGRCDMGVIAVRGQALRVEGTPGITLLLDAPFGGGMVAQQVMGIFGQHGIGGVLAHSEEGSSRAYVKLIYCPNWYANADDKTFGVDWPKVVREEIAEGEGKALWCQGVEKALRSVLKTVPSLCIDGLFFDCYAANDRLSLMTPDELLALSKVKASDLEAHLSKRAS